MLKRRVGPHRTCVGCAVFGSLAPERPLFMGLKTDHATVVCTWGCSVISNPTEQKLSVFGLFHRPGVT